MHRIAVCLLLASGLAHADDAAPVDLLRATAATVAVSSTVDNAKIKPDHLIDGDMKTAWNSRTGELEGAWIAFRVPADAKIAAIKLTSGFTHVDKKLGDLFAQNPRIEKVRVARDGITIGDFPLDPENRGLQELKVTAPGGDFRITVLETVAGTKKTWREVCVSELQVWGTTPAPAKKPAKPLVRIASLDAPPALTRAECIKAVLPSTKGTKIVATDQIGLSPDITICRVDHHPRDEKGDELTVEIAVVARATRKVLAREDHLLEVGIRPDEGEADRDAVQLELFPLSATETGVLVQVTDRREAPMLDEGTTKTTLHRVTKTGWTPVLELESTWSEGEGGTSDTCELQPAARSAKLADKLKVECIAATSDWHNPDESERGVKEKRRVLTYRWNGTSYAR